MDTFYFRVKKYIEEQQMILPGDTVVAGVSGGADSLCLFHILHQLSGEAGFRLHVVHVHHGLRDSAQGDLEFVEETCRQAGVPCETVLADAADMAGRWKTGVEEAGRRLRYQAFEDACRRIGDKTGSRCRIAVAHHREDQAETVLFRLCRGTDLRGARGMLPVNGRIIRPLLCESRASIEQYLQAKGLSWREDETNLDTSYTRNYLRREIIPRLREGVNAAAAEKIARFAASCAEADRYLDAVTDQALRRCTGGGPEFSGSLSVAALLQEDPYIQGRILYRCLADSSRGCGDAGSVHVEALLRLCRGTGGGRLSMPGEVTAVRTGDRLFFLRGEETELPRPALADASGDAFGETAQGVSGDASRGASGETSGDASVEGFEAYSDGSMYTSRVFAFDGDMSAIPRNQYTKWFDYDKIGMFPVFRVRQPGDRMTLLGEGKDLHISKKLARVMLDGKISRGLRDRMILPFAGKEALWIPGLRMGDAFRVSPDTKRILEISYKDNQSC